MSGRGEKSGVKEEPKDDLEKRSSSAIEDENKNKDELEQELKCVKLEPEDWDDILPASLDQPSFEKFKQETKPLFQMVLTADDVDELTIFLSIPRRAAENHFPHVVAATDGSDPAYVMLQVVDDTNRAIIPMKLSRDSNNSYQIEQGWRAFFKTHDLRSNDMVTFYGTRISKDDKRYLITFDRDPGGPADSEEETDDIPVAQVYEIDDSEQSDHNRDDIVPASLDQTSFEKFTQETEPLFQMVLTADDVDELTIFLSIPRRAAENHFPHVVAAADGSDPAYVMLQVVDDTNRAIIPMKLSRDSNDSYQIEQGWRAFFKTHNLQSNDMVTFYGTQSSKDDRRYLITFDRGPGGPADSEEETNDIPVAQVYEIEDSDESDHNNNSDDDPTYVPGDSE